MDEKNFSVKSFDLKGDQYKAAFPFLTGIFKSYFRNGKVSFTKEEIIQIFNEAVEYAKEETKL